MAGFAGVDGIALTVFVISWLGYSWLLDHSAWRRHSLTSVMNRERRLWMERMAEREVRIVDTSIMSGLQNGTAFFASASLLAIGGAFTLLNATDHALDMVRSLPLGAGETRAVWEMKTLGLVAIYAYAFFKFGWSYRLFNYASIMVGAVPPASQIGSGESEAAISRAAEMTVQAGHHFSLGQRAFFFSVGFMGWFANAWIFMALTAIVDGVLVHRQFGSPALRMMQSRRA